MIEFIQHALGLCPDHHSHINILSILGEQGWINQIIQILKLKFK